MLNIELNTKGRMITLIGAQNVKQTFLIINLSLHLTEMA